MNDIINAMQGGGKHLADLVIVGMTGTHLADEVEQRLQDLRLDDISIYRVSEINAYKRAVRLAIKSEAVDERQWNVAKVKGDAIEIVHQFVGRKIVDSSETRISDKAVAFHHEVATKFDVAAYRNGTKKGEMLLAASNVDHPIAQKVMALFRSIHSEASSNDLNRATLEAFEAHHGVRLRTAGGAWVLPAAEADWTRRWATWAAPYGQALVIPIHESEEANKAIEASARDSIEDGLAALMDDLDKYQQENTRLSTLESRLEKLDEMRDKVATYERILSVSMDELHEGIKNAEKSFVKAISKIGIQE